MPHTIIVTSKTRKSLVKNWKGDEYVKDMIRGLQSFLLEEENYISATYLEHKIKEYSFSPEEEFFEYAVYFEVEE